jgi:hypothetical protein
MEFGWLGLTLILFAFLLVFVLFTSGLGFTLGG